MLVDYVHVVLADYVHVTREARQKILRLGPAAMSTKNTYGISKHVRSKIVRCMLEYSLEVGLTLAKCINRAIGLYET